MTTFKTKNNLPENVRREVIQLLNARLADGLDLSLQAKQAHWNVKGPHFAPLHDLFESLYEEASEWTDLMAERAVQLGGSAEGTLQTIGSRTKLPPYPLQIADGRSHLESISSALGQFAASVRAAIDASANAGDAVTADLFTEVGRAADKKLWFVEAHLQAER